MKTSLTVLFIAVCLNLHSQNLDGIYKFKSSFDFQDTSIYLFQKDHYKHLYTINSWNGRDTHIRKVSKGEYKSGKDRLIIYDDQWSGDKDEYKLEQITDSGIYYHWVENIKVFIGKIQMSQAEFNSMFGTFEKIARKQPGIATKAPTPGDWPRKLVLQNAVTKKTKILRQGWDIDIYRAHTDTLFHHIDTFLQVLNGYIDSIGDSLIYVKAYSFSINNHHTLSGWYDFSQDRPEINMQWDMSAGDTLICFPKNQVIGIKQYKSATMVGNALITASLTNVIASPFYSIDYKTFEVNKPLFKTSLLVSAGVFLTGIIIDIFASPSYYSLCKNCKKHWVLTGLKN